MDLLINQTIIVIAFGWRAQNSIIEYTIIVPSQRNISEPHYYSFDISVNTHTDWASH